MRVRYAMAALAVGACLVASACSPAGTSGQGAAPPASSAPAAAGSSASQASGPGGVWLPCDPKASTCWIPAAGETYMSYKPPRHYASAETLAAAAGCTVLSGAQYSPATPAAQKAECSLNGATEGSYLTEAMLFSSPQAEASWAGSMAQGAKTNDNAFYGLLGPGWAIGSIFTVDDTRALQAQATTGGLVVCFPDSTDAGGDCSP
jgi:hypothetical protein